MKLRHIRSQYISSCTPFAKLLRTNHTTTRHTTTTSQPPTHVTACCAWRSDCELRARPTSLARYSPPQSTAPPPPRLSAGAHTCAAPAHHRLGGQLARARRDDQCLARVAADVSVARDRAAGCERTPSRLCGRVPRRACLQGPRPLHAHLASFHHERDVDAARVRLRLLE